MDRGRWQECLWCKDTNVRHYTTHILIHSACSYPPSLRFILLRSALFWDITRRRVVIFFTDVPRDNVSVPSSRVKSPSRKESQQQPITWIHGKCPEESRSHHLRGGSLKSKICFDIILPPKLRYSASWCGNNYLGIFWGGPVRMWFVMLGILRFLVFLSLSRIFGDNTSIRPRPLPSKSWPVIYS
jgi:hypothetical protein